MNKDFEWTDDLVKKYISTRLQDTFQDMNHFKERHIGCKEPDIYNWEIITVRKNKSDPILVSSFCSNTIEEILERFTIHSVKRLSDGLIFSVDEDTPDGKIIRFEIVGESIKVTLQHDRYLWFHTLEKLAARKKIFTTEDGKDIYEWDDYWFVDTGLNISPRLKAHGTGHDERYKRFSTEEAARIYINWNKPCISVKEIYDLLKVHGMPYANEIADVMLTFAQSKK